MIPTNEQIELISGTIALLMDDFSGALDEAGAVAEAPEDETVSEAALARTLAVSLGRGSDGAELQRLLRGAHHALKLSLTIV